MVAPERRGAGKIDRTIRRGSAALVALVLVLLLPPAWAGARGVPAGGRGYAGSSGDAATSRPEQVAQPPPGALPGIDVSHYQDEIDWAAVAASGVRFAVAKATEGRTFVDPMYATNKVGAEGNGVVFGAYHFARPDDGANDAVLEADHFVDTAQLTAGNLIPTLDIERTGGLTQSELTTWILTWLDRVTERIGVRPMVYTSPNGWETRTGDTTAIVDAGYTVLWVAHWGVSSPRLPANSWGGYGWTFWQYDDCGHVPGIGGCVDVDWKATSTFDGVTVPNPDVRAPTETLATPPDVTGPVTVRFSEIVHGVSASNVYVWAPESGEIADSALTCRSAKGAIVSCSTGNVRTVVVQPRETLVTGESYEAVVNPATASSLVVDRAGNPAVASVAAFATATELEQRNPALAYAWRTATNHRAYGRSFAVERAAGATASFDFTGRSVTWYTVRGPSQGRAAVSIDGRPMGTFDQYASSTTWRAAHSFTKLSRGAHTITIRVLGRGSASATDALVTVDAFGTHAGVSANPDLAASWGSLRAGGASGGSVATSDLARASVELEFRGTGVQWQTVRGRDQGRAEVYVDGALVKTVDNFAKTRAFGVVRSIGGLAEGIHTLRIVVLGESRPAATGAFVSIDRLVVVP